jgi:hypothetical protein
MNYSLKKDHTAIKKHIKEWEIAIDGIVRCPDRKCEDCMSELEDISHEMMAINL